MNAKERKEAVRQEAAKELRAILKPGDTVQSILRHVSRSGMNRNISFTVVKKDEVKNLDNLIATVLDYRRSSDGSLSVGGCGQDMGFHVIHLLGYALFGEEAEHGDTPKAQKLRRALLENDRFYYTQGGRPAPDPSKPSRVWFGRSGYALKHRWI